MKRKKIVSCGIILSVLTFGGWYGANIFWARHFDLMELTDLGAADMVAYVCRWDARQLSRTDRQGDTPLHRAAAAGQADVVTALVAHGANVKAANSAGETPLHGAQTRAIAAVLLARGAAVNAASANGSNPLHLAVSWGRVEVVELLIQHGATVNAQCQDGRTPLDFAGDCKTVALLRGQGAKSGLELGSVKTPLADPALGPTQDRVVELCRDVHRLEQELAAGEDELAAVTPGDQPQLAARQQQLAATRDRQAAAMWKLVAELTAARRGIGEYAGPETLGLVLAERDPEMLAHLQHELQRLNCAGRLKLLGVRLQEYAAAHGGRFPDHLTALVPHYLEAGADAVRCPAGGEYVYVGKGCRSDAADTAAQPLAFDRLENHRGEWITILYANGQVTGVRVSGQRLPFAGKDAELNRLLTGAGTGVVPEGTRAKQK